jgi:hypothetical protein
MQRVFSSSGSLPLTLTLSPQAGRGDLPHEPLLFEENGAAYPLRPACGEKGAGRPDEGQLSASTVKAIATLKILRKPRR